MKKNKYSLKGLQEQARYLAHSLGAGNVVCLIGDLGSGKTTFAAALINELTGELNATSPTFNLVHTYNHSRFLIWHFDLYRLKSIEEVYHLGIEDAFGNGLTIIEWPEIIESILPANAIKIRIDFAEHYDSRYISIQNR